MIPNWTNNIEYKPGERVTRRKGGLIIKIKKIYWLLEESFYDIKESKHKIYDLRNILCRFGLHWPIEWSEYAHPGSELMLEPPESDWACSWCGKVKEPYRAIFWWPIKERYYIYKLSKRD